MDCSPPGSSVEGILQTRILAWVAIPCSRGSSQPSYRAQVCCIAGRFLIFWATYVKICGGTVGWLFEEGKPAVVSLLPVQAFHPPLLVHPCAHLPENLGSDVWIHLPASFLLLAPRQWLPLIWLCLDQSSVTFQIQNCLALALSSVIPSLWYFRSGIIHETDITVLSNFSKNKTKIPLTSKQWLCQVSLNSPPSVHTVFFSLWVVLTLNVMSNIVKWLKPWALGSERQKWILQITGFRYWECYHLFLTMTLLFVKLE